MKERKVSERFVCKTACLSYDLSCKTAASAFANSVFNFRRKAATKLFNLKKKCTIINKQTNKNKQQSIKIKQILTLTFHVLVNSRPLETPFSPAPSAARAFPGVPPLAAPAGSASLSRRCCLARTWRDEVSWPRPRTGTPCWGIYGGCKQHTALVSLKLLNLFGEQGLLVRILLTCSRCVSSEFHPRVVDFAQMPSCALVGELQSVPKMKKNELWLMLN